MPPPMPSSPDISNKALKSETRPKPAQTCPDLGPESDHVAPSLQRSWSEGKTPVCTQPVAAMHATGGILHRGLWQAAHSYVNDANPASYPSSPAMAPPTRVMTEQRISVGSVQTGSLYGPRSSIGCVIGRLASASTASLACQVSSAFVTAASTACSTCQSHKCHELVHGLDFPARVTVELFCI